jgi:SAM-dependent methyltransferase
MASILIVTGGDPFARSVFEGEDRADWSQAMPLVLEKLGYLDFEVAGPEALGRPDSWRRRGAVLVTRLPREAWTPRAVELASRGTVPALIELPPSTLHTVLGISSAEEAPGFGVVAALPEWLRDAIAASTSLSSTRLEVPQSRPVDRDPALNWTRLGVPIAERQAERWRAPGWDVRRWEVADGAEVLAEWLDTESDSGRWPALIQRGNLFASCFSIFAYLGQQTTIHPFRGEEYVNWSRSAALEAMLAAVLDRMHRAAGRLRARVLPWPAGARWVLSVRHDYDRALSRAEVQNVLTAHKVRGTAATWYWRAGHLAGEGAALARGVDRAPGNEVAHHTERLWQEAGEEERAIDQAIGRRVSGTSAHGDPNCFRWQGAPNVLWAERHGLDYTEFISHAHLQPHRFAALEPDGRIRPARVLCLPHHVSFDRSMDPADAAADEVVSAAGEYLRAGGMMQVLNHPDLSHAEFFATLERMPLDGRLDWTAAAAADWWRRSHVRGELTVIARNDGSVRLVSARGVRGLALEVLMPDGARRRQVISIDPGAEVTISVDSAPAHRPLSRQQLWTRQASPIFAEAVRGYYARQGLGPHSAEVKATLATNTNLVPNRVEAILEHARRLRGAASLAGVRVLDVGCGFGAFAAYLALDPDEPAVTAIDVREDFVQTATETARRLELGNLSFQASDARSLTGLEHDNFDLVIVNNSFIYLPTAPDMARALDEIVRVTAPGGAIVFHHANRWALRDPFTGAPLVHLMPPRIAERVSRVTGWRHGHGRVRLVSAPWLARGLRSRGVDSVYVHPRGRRPLPPRAWFSRFYTVCGRKRR